MTEDAGPRADGEAEQSAASPSPQRAASPSPAPTQSLGGGDLDLVEPESQSKPLLDRLNPMKMFQKETPARLVKEGRTLAEQRNYAQATVSFNRALGMDPEYAPAFEGLGDVLVKKGGRTNVKAAIDQHREVAVRDPQNERVYASMSKAYNLLGMRKEAALEKKKLVVVKTLQREPKNPAANNNMGILYLQQKQVPQALDYFNRAIEADSRYDTALRNMAITYYRLAHEATDPAKKEAYLDKAKPLVSRALEVAEHPLTLLTHARILIEDEQYEQALEACDKAQAIDPGQKDVFGLKKVILLELNRYEDANAAFETYQYLNSHDTPPQGGGPAEEG